MTLSQAMQLLGIKHSFNLIRTIYSSNENHLLTVNITQEYFYISVDLIKMNNFIQ